MNNIPLKPVTLKTVNRFPAIYKIQAQQAIRYEVRGAIRMTADVMAMASILAAIEEFGCGTAANSTKIHKYISRLQSIVDTGADYYDDAVAIGLKNRLSALGIEYRSNEDERN
jgi:hypothetical protein